MTWQPIETAPKDCGELLLWVPDAEDMLIGTYLGGPEAGWHLGWTLIRIHPTHWMPLPEPPEESE